MTLRIPRWFRKWYILATARANKRNYKLERSDLPEHRFDRVHIYGNSSFATQITEALSRLKQTYPYGYSLVRRYVDAIVQSNTTWGMGIAIGVVYQKTDSNGRLSVSADRYAANLVRYAVVIRKLKSFYLCRSPRSELSSLNRELRAMRLLQCDEKYFHRVLNLILEKERQIREEKGGNI